MRDLQKIVNELNESKLRSLMTTSDLVNVAVQLQRNEILGDAIGDDTLINLTSTLEELVSELKDLNRTMHKISETLYNKE